ncbi:MAG: efflux RND transporter periplasmic adaptor subunit [Desulfobacterales bacterium]|nr:efflux RND transporter periplasmic adaptor subunit [Desulfobacterales bacterium]MDD4073428.1 efflux RND transporter periplasmic adaptor subunit [Desulfobacterales bacterium]MDD4391358.1 efflux RND transporter periplasmic adaptor subunit [Desulfobacterales bacterium]
MTKNRLIAAAGILLVGVILAVILFGMLNREKIAPGSVQGDEPPGFIPAHTIRASVKTITEWYEAVGTIRPKTEARIEAQIAAQVIDVKVSPGDKVAKHQLLVLLDDRQQLSRLDQARQGLTSVHSGKIQVQQAIHAATAAFTQAASAYKRTKTYFQSEAATAQDMEQAEAVYLQATAELNRARESLTTADTGIRQAEAMINEATIALGYSRIEAPEDGEVLKRLVEPGDLALPGKPLILLQTTGILRLEAVVREGLISRVRPGTSLKAAITALEKPVDAIVEEIVPYADPRTRTFLVKASLPGLQGLYPDLYPGMYGKLLIPVSQHQVVLIPDHAVRHVGQLELVMVSSNGQWEKRLIKTGRSFDTAVEVLSGLEGTETIGVER